MARLEEMWMYNNIMSIRPDGAQLGARRIVQDTKTPIYWEITLVDSNKQYIEDEIPTHDSVGKRKRYLTGELSTLARKSRFTEWHQSLLAQTQGVYIDHDGQEKNRGFNHYELPDTTPYPLK